MNSWFEAMTMIDIPDALEDISNDYDRHPGSTGGHKQ